MAMKKNVRRGILLALVVGGLWAAGTGDILALDINGNQTDQVYGVEVDTETEDALAENGVINWNSGNSSKDAFAGFAGAKGTFTATAQKNTFTGIGGQVQDIFGGFAYSEEGNSTAKDNVVNLNGIDAQQAYGGVAKKYEAGGEAVAENNVVKLTKGNIQEVCGGEALGTNATAKAEYNQVKVEKGDAALSVEKIYGGQVDVTANVDVSASHNTVEIKGGEGFTFGSANGAQVNINKEDLDISKITLNGNAVKAKDAKGNLCGALVKVKKGVRKSTIKIREVEANGNRIETDNTEGRVWGVNIDGCISKLTAENNIIKMMNPKDWANGIKGDFIGDDLQSFEVNKNEITYESDREDASLGKTNGVHIDLDAGGTAQINANDNVFHYVNGRVWEVHGVKIKTSTVNHKILEGTIGIRNNTMEVSGGTTLSYVVAAESHQLDTNFDHSENLEVALENNTLRVTGGEHNSAYAVRNYMAAKPKYQVVGNGVILQGGKIQDQVSYLRNEETYEAKQATIKDNYVLIDGTGGNLDLTEANLSGISGENLAYDPAGYSGNRLEVKAFNGIIRKLSMRGFNEVIFDVTNAATDSPILEVMGGDNPKATDFQGVKVTARDLSGATDEKEYVLLKNQAKIQNVAKADLGRHLISGTLTTQRYGLLSLSKDKTELRLLAGVEGAPEVTAPTTAARYYGVAVGALTDGDELILRSLNDLAALDDGEYGAFAAVRYGKTEYDVVDVRTSDTKLVAGAGKSDLRGNGKLSYGVFLEMGWNSFDHTAHDGMEAIFSDVDSNYYGLGVAARLERDDMYYDAALRFGRVKNEVDSAASGISLYDYETKSNYVGARLQVGQVRDMGNYELDLYGRYSYLRVGSDDLNVGGEDVHFGSVNSNRLRVGARANFDRGGAWNFYAGAAYEHEFSGSVDVTANGLDANADLDGGTFIGELGATMANEGPWEFRLGLEGFAGNREGFGATARATYRF